MDGASLTFVGNATTLLRLGSFVLLTDPNFLHRGQRAYLGKGLWSRRLTEPAMQPEDLPDLDAVVLSHLHGDHFDRAARRRLSRGQPVFTTPAAARRLGSWGFAAEGLRTWQGATLRRGAEELRLESMPGTHARGAMRALLPPVMGTLLEHRAPGQPPLRLYLSGDTLTGSHLDAVRERCADLGGPLDVAVLHLGGTRVLFHTVTMDGAQGADALRRLRPGRAVPVHYDDYRVFKSPLQDFLQEAGRVGLADRVQVVERGTTTQLRPAAVGA